MVLFFWGLTVFCVACCAALTLRRAVHIFQLESYQHPSYRAWLERNRAEVHSCKRWLPVLLMTLGVYLGAWWLVLLGGGLFVLLCRPPRAKRPLVYTPRLKRLLLTAALCFIGYCLLCGYGYYWGVAAALSAGSIVLLLAASLLPLTAPAVCVLLGYRLVLLYDLIDRPLEKTVSDYYIDDARKILAGMPGLKVVGITGSYGKTSTKLFLYKLLSTRYEVYMTPGNYNTTLGVVRAVREGLRPTHQIFLCEMGARRRGDIREICRLVKPTVGVLTSIGPQHLETFGSQTNIVRGKWELCEEVADNGGVMFLNYDSPLVAAEPCEGKHITFGSNNCDYTISNQVVDAQGSRFTVTAPDGQRQVFRTRLLGEANVQDLCGAVAAAHELGVPLSELAAAARALEPVPHRLELKRREGLSLIDDAYNSNPEGAQVALRALALCGGTRICITPGLVELGEQELAYNRELGAYAAPRCDWLLTVGKGERAAAIREGAAEAGLRRDRIAACDTIQDALARAYALDGDDKLALLLNDLTDNY